MGFPGVNISIENGNLLRSVSVLDGVPALVATAAAVGNIGVVKQVYSLADAETKGITLATEPFLYGLIKEYYEELGGNQLLYVLGLAETVTMADMLTSSNASGVMKVLNASAGAINLVAVARKPVAGYNAGTGFLDTDVALAVTASKTLCSAQQAKNQPLRVLVEGRVANKAVANAYTPTSAENGYCGVVLGGTSTNGSAAVSLALARAVKYGSHVKLGSGQNGALTATQIYIGSDKIEDRTDMSTLHDAGFITFHHRPGIAGYFFGRDNMCSTDDFSILAHGRIADKGQRLAAIAMTPYIEDYIRINADGTINETDALELETVIKTAIQSKMNGQISDVKVYIDPSQNVVANSTLAVRVSILPLGYLTWINITLGLTTATA